MEIQSQKKDQTDINLEIPKTCWNIKRLNNKDSISSIIVPTTDNRQNNTDFPSLKEASSKLNKNNVKNIKSKVKPPLLRKQSKKSLGDIKVLQINNLHLNYQEYYSPVKKEFKFSKSFTDVENNNNEKIKEDLSKAIVPYSPYGNYYNVFTPPPFSLLYRYWWKIPRCGFDVINGENSNNSKSQLKELLNIINDKDILSNDDYDEQEYQNMLNILKTLNLKFCDMTQSNYDSSYDANKNKLCKIKIKDINPPSDKNQNKRKSKLVKLESIIPKNESEIEINKITHLDDIFKVFQGIKVTNGPSSKYTILMHILFYLTPRELCLMTRVCKVWRKELLNSKYSVELWWNIWMNIVWVGKAQKEKEDYDKYLERSRSIDELNISVSSSNESLTLLSSLSNFGSCSSLNTKISKKLMFPWYHSITRAERKRGTKVWVEKSIEEYRKTEVRAFEILSNPSSSDEESSSESDDDSTYRRPEGRGKLTSEEKNESRTQYKLMGSKPKTKRPWAREKGLSKE